MDVVGFGFGFGLVIAIRTTSNLWERRLSTLCNYYLLQVVELTRSSMIYSLTGESCAVSVVFVDTISLL
jgi:hypothetical protein